MSNNALLRVEHLVKDYHSRHRTLRAVDDVSFSVDEGETLALVGESGSGKTTTALCSVLLERPTAGVVRFGGINMTSSSPTERRVLRREVQFVFQDPASSLNNRLRVGQIVREPLDIHNVDDKVSRRERANELLVRVGLPEDAGARRPGQFSGGQRQRIGIARALALRPRLIVCDEPVSALDVSVQAQVVNLLADLQREFGIAYLFIAHDLAVVRHLAHRIAVMYMGTVVEVGPPSKVFRTPLHPYTSALISAAPTPDPDYVSRRIVLNGEPPSAFARPAGCPFAPRCWRADERCHRERPTIGEHDPDHFVACHYPLSTQETHP